MSDDDVIDYVAHVHDLRNFANNLVELNLAVSKEYERCQQANEKITEEDMDRFHIAITDLREFLWKNGFGRV